MIHVCICISQSSFFADHMKYSSANNGLAVSQFSCFSHHCSILYCISLVAEMMHIDLHMLINMAFRHQLPAFLCIIPSLQAITTSPGAYRATVTQEMQPWRLLLSGEWKICEPETFQWSQQSWSKLGGRECHPGGFPSIKQCTSKAIRQRPAKSYNQITHVKMRSFK